MKSREEDEKQDTSESVKPDPSRAAADAIAEMVGDADIHIEDDHAIVIANELLEKFTSPLMIQKAAGASSQVSITMDPAGHVETARSVKGRNVLINLKDAAFASLSSLPALTILVDKYGKPGSGLQVAVAGVIALFGMLKTLSSASGITLTQRTAGVLHTMWSSKMKDRDIVPHDGLLEKVNSQFERYQWQKIDAEELLTHLETLERLKSIEREDPNNSISMEKIHCRLIEQVKHSY
jgi:hypothetical protein